MLFVASTGRMRMFARLVKAVWIACIGLSALSAGAAVTVREVSIDGRAVDLGRADADAGMPRPLRLRGPLRNLSISFARTGNAARPDTRLRYQLVGHDHAWRDVSREMRALLIFYDERRAIVGKASSPFEGETPGWTGDPATSPYVKRRFSATAPERGFGARINFLTHGGESAVGVVAIDAVRVRVEPAQGGEPLIHDLMVTSSSQTTWLKEGSLLHLSRTATRAGSDPHPVLVLEDNDALNYGSWSLSPARQIPVSPGDRVTLEWETAYSIGDSGPADVTYTSLEPGNYEFRVAEYSPNGVPLAAGEAFALPIVVVPPLYRRSQFWAVLAAVAAAGAALAARVVEVRRTRQHIAALERGRALEAERARIARELHDDLGAGLTAIAMRSDRVRSACGASLAADARRDVDSVCRTAVELVRVIDEIVWTVNPANDTLERFVNYVMQYTEQYLDAGGLRLRFDIARDIPPLTLTGDMRHALLLAIKEALHNVVKHARAEMVGLTIVVESGRLRVVVEDDGKGMEAAGVSESSNGTHNGIANIRRHMAKVGGMFEWSPRPGGGTRVTFTAPLAGGEGVRG